MLMTTTSTSDLQRLLDECIAQDLMEDLNDDMKKVDLSIERSKNKMMNIGSLDLSDIIFRTIIHRRGAIIILNADTLDSYREYEYI